MPAMPNDPSSVRADEDWNEGKEAEMPTTVKEAFEKFDEALKLDPTEREDAIETHNAMREHLKESGVAGNSILQGSFARKTMLSPLGERDVDIVAFLKEEHRDPRVSPDKAMGLVEDSLWARYPQAAFDRSKHAVKADLGGDGPSFDIVPAFDRENSQLVEIANCESGDWDESDTRMIIQEIQKHNKKCNGRFIHQVRMAKYWAKKAFDGDIPGFVLECISYWAIRGSRSHAEALHAVFVKGVSMLQEGEVKVPGSDENILDRLSESQKSNLAKQLEYAKSRSLEAIHYEEDGDHRAAIGVWHEIFGDPFPEPLAGSPEDVWGAAGVTSAGDPTFSTRSHSPQRKVRSWLLHNDSIRLHTQEKEFLNIGLEDNNMIGMNYLLEYPEEVCAYISSRDGPYCVLEAEVRSYRENLVLWMTLQPVTPLQDLGFRIENIKVIVNSKYYWIKTFPRNGNTRRWYHRNFVGGDLCLWYPQDPRPLRWEWEDGFIPYLGIVSYHLQAEEWYRRYRVWPFEDAPHGHGPGGSPHPILTNQMRREVRRLR